MAPRQFQMFGTEFSGDEVVRSPLGDDAKRHLRRAQVLPLAAVLLIPAPLVIEVSFASAALIAVAAAYVLWSSYWGVVAAFRVTTNLAAREAPDTFKGEFALNMGVELFGIVGLAFVAPFVAGVLYGVCGGALREYWRWRRVARHPGLSIT